MPQLIESKEEWIYDAICNNKFKFIMKPNYINMTIQQNIQIRITRKHLILHHLVYPGVI